eukprot:scaffold7203_cov416-Prasinococcus_capsulatus_cf.AAC.7
MGGSEQSTAQAHEPERMLETKHPAKTNATCGGHGAVRGEDTAEGIPRGRVLACARTHACLGPAAPPESDLHCKPPGVRRPFPDTS